MTHMESRIGIMLFACWTCGLALTAAARADDTPMPDAGRESEPGSGSGSGVPGTAPVGDSSPRAAGAEAIPAIWAERLVQLRAEVAALQTKAEAEQAETAELAEQVADLQARATRWSWIVLLASFLDLGSWPFWLLLPTFLVLSLLLLIRPEVLTRFFEPALLRHCYALPARGTLLRSKAVRWGLLAAVVVAFLLITVSAFAQEPPAGEPDAAEEEPLVAEELPPPEALQLLEALRQLVSSDTRTQQIIKLELLRSMRFREVVFTRPAEFPDQYPVVHRISAGSLEHATALAMLYLLGGQEAKLAQADRFVATSMPKRLDGTGTLEIAALLRFSIQRQQLTRFPLTLKVFVQRATDVLLLVDLASTVVATSPEAAALLAARAEKVARSPEETLLVLGYLKAAGGSEELEEKLEKLKLKLAQTKKAAALISVYVAASRYGFPELAAEMLTRLQEAQLKTSDALLFLERGALVNATAQALPLLAAALAREEQGVVAFKGLDAGQVYGSDAVVNAAVERLLTLAEARGFPAADFVLRGFGERGMKPQLERAFAVALRHARNGRDCATLSEFARRHLEERQVDQAVMRSISFLRSGRELREVLSQALADRKLTLALAAALRLTDLAPGATWPPPTSLPLAADRPFYDDEIRLRSLANVLRHELREAGALQDQAELMLPLLITLLFEDPVHGSEESRRVAVNDLAILAHLLAASGSDVLARFVVGPLGDRVLKALELDPPLPRAIQAEYRQLEARQAESSLAVNRAQAERAAFREQLPLLEQTVAAHERELLVGLFQLLGLTILALLALFILLTSSLQAAREAREFKTYTFVQQALETLGWEAVVTVVLAIPGLLLVLMGQLLGLLASINRHVDRRSAADGSAQPVARAEPASATPPAAGEGTAG